MFSFFNRKPKIEIVAELPAERPHVKIYTDGPSLEIVGKHDPTELATMLFLFSRGEMSQQLSEALIASGVDDEWISKYQKSAQELIADGQKQQKKKAGPIISALEAFR